MTAAKMAPSTSERAIGEQRHLLPALGTSLRELLGPAHVSTGTRLQTEAPQLDRRLLHETVDVVIGEPPDPAARPLVGVEVKTGANARKLGQTPYHTLKLASMRRLH